MDVIVTLYAEKNSINRERFDFGFPLPFTLFKADCTHGVIESVCFDSYHVLRFFNSTTCSIHYSVDSITKNRKNILTLFGFVRRELQQLPDRFLFSL